MLIDVSVDKTSIEMCDLSCSVLRDRETASRRLHNNYNASDCATSTLFTLLETRLETALCELIYSVN